MIKAILFDFDGVLSQDRFYEEMLLPHHQELYNWMQKNIFGNEDLFRQWMRNELKTDDVHKIIASNTNYKESFLDEVLSENLKSIRLDKEMLNLANNLKRKHHKKVALITNNVDVFSSVIAKNLKLNDIFDVVINSADYGCLKTEEGGRLFDEALSFLSEKIENCLLIDDSFKNINFFKQKGGHGFLYNNNFKELTNFLKQAS